MVESRNGSGSVQVTGLLVDRVSDVLEFAPEEIQPAPQLGLGKATPFVRGLIRHQDGFLLVLDVDRVFTALGSLHLGSSAGDGNAPGQGGEGSDVATPDMTAGAGPPSGELEPWSERDFAPIVAFLRTQIGITLEPHRMGLLQARLRSRLQANGFSSFTQFSERVLKADPTGPGMQLLIDLSTVNHTAFFREPGHFTFMAERVAASSEGAAGLGGPDLVGGLLDRSRAVQHGDGPRRDDPRDYRAAGRNLGERPIQARCWKPPRGRSTTRATFKGYPPRGSAGSSSAAVARAAGSFRVVPEIRDMVKFRHLDLRTPSWSLPNDFHHHLLPQRLDLLRRGRADGAA